MAAKSSIFVGTALISASILALGLATAAPALAQDVKTERVAFDIPAQPLSKALAEFMRQSNVTIIAPTSMTRGKMSNSVSGNALPVEALNTILHGTGLDIRERRNGAYALIQHVAQVEEKDRTDRNAVDRAELEVEEIVVTGTNIRGVVPASSPFFVFDREDIDKAGFTTIEQFLESLPQNFTGGATTDTAGATTNSDAGLNQARGVGIDLRGLGSGATLVLMNGRRISPIGFGNYVDVSLIPLSAVERVEVITDGASAVYGTDAIAGVVNFVLIDDYDGAQTSVEYGAVTDGGFDQVKASQSLGKSWTSGSALVAYEYSRRDELRASKRDFAIGAGADPDLYLTPQTEAHTALVSLKQDVTDRMEISADGIYTSRDNEFATISSFSNQFFRAKTNQYNVSTGAAFEFFEDWRVEFTGSYGVTNLDIEQMFLDFDLALDSEQDNKVWTVDSKVDGSLFEVPAGEVKLAVGSGYRNEQYDFGPTLLDRDVVYAFGEVFVPIVSEQNAIPGVERFELSVAGRFEDYSDFGSATNPKVGIVWSPGAGLNLRGTYGTSFNAPDLSNLDNSNRVVGLADFPNTQGATTLGIFVFGGPVELDPEESTAWTAGVDYEPEDILTGFSVSMTYYDIEFTDRISQPAASLFAPLLNPDVFAPIITFNPTSQQVADIVATAPVFANLSSSPEAGPEDGLVIVDNSLQNLAVTNTSGLDLSANYAQETSFGSLDFSLNGSYIFEFENAVSQSSPTIDVVNTVFNPVGLRLRAGFGWSSQWWSSNIFVNYTDDYTDDTTVPEGGIDAWTTIDLTVSYDASIFPPASILDNMVFSVNVLNVFNEAPPFFGGLPPFLTIGYDPANANPFGRFIAFRISKEW